MYSLYTTRGCRYLDFRHLARDGRLHDVGSVQAVHAVGAEHAALLADHALGIRPGGTETAKYLTLSLLPSSKSTFSQPS